LKRLLALGALLALTACGNGGNSKTGPDVRFTLPPGGAFKDALVLAGIKAKLAADDIDSTTRISVDVHGGAVTLRGRVPTTAAKIRAVATAKSVAGVNSVTDDLHVGNVGRSSAQSASDFGLTAQVEAKLVAQAGINVAGVKVTAKSGTVTLAGHAPTAAVKSTMLEAAKSIEGVRNVVDQIAVK